MRPLIMAYLTDGFYEWAKFFLCTFKYYHNDDTFDIVLVTRGLDDYQIYGLESLYGRLRVLNTPYDLAYLSKVSGLNMDALLAQKEQIEKGYVTQRTRCWKLLHAGDDRVKAMHECYIAAGLHEYTHFISFDIDTYFRGSIAEELERTLNSGDEVYAKLRLKHSTLKARITIDMMIFKTNCLEIDNFMADWRSKIVATPPYFRPIGYGQLTCYAAYLESALRWKALPLTFGLPGVLKEDQLIWTGNIHKKTKVEVLEMFKDDFSRRQAVE